MSHTRKTPPIKVPTSDLPTDVYVGTVALDTTTNEQKIFNGTDWSVVQLDHFNSPTIVFDSTGPSYHQIQGDIPISWKNGDLSLKGVVIGTSCVVINHNAFFGCSGFTGVLTIPSSVTTINISAFYNCSGFTGTLTIPNSVTSIGTSAFSNCTGFTALSIGTGLTTLGNGAFNDCSGFTGTLTIPNTVTGTLGASAFFGCSGFTALSIGTGITTIGSSAFAYCSGFTGTLTIPSNVTTINSSAFFGCSGFTRIEIDNATAPTIGINAFASVAPSDGNIHVPAGATGYAASYDGYTVVYDL